jgi:hypothetical protein
MILYIKKKIDFLLKNLMSQQVEFILFYFIFQKFFLCHGSISGVCSEAPNDMLTREVHHNLGAMKIRHAMMHDATLFCRCTALLRLVPATVTCTIILSQNHFPESNRYWFDFLHPFLLCRITY